MVSRAFEDVRLAADLGAQRAVLFLVHRLQAPELGRMGLRKARLLGLVRGLQAFELGGVPLALLLNQVITSRSSRRTSFAPSTFSPTGKYHTTATYTIERAQHVQQADQANARAAASLERGEQAEGRFADQERQIALLGEQVQRLSAQLDRAQAQHIPRGP